MLRRRFAGGLLAITMGLLVACSSGGTDPLVSSGDPATARPLKATTGPSVKTAQVVLGRDENTAIVAVDDDTVAVVDGASKDAHGNWRLTVWLGEPSGPLTPYRLQGRPLVFVDAFADGDAVVIIGLECPDFVPEEPEEPTTDDICGTRPRREVAYRFSTSGRSWQLLNDHLPSGSLGGRASPDSSWVLLLDHDDAAAERFLRLDARSGKLTQLAAFHDNRHPIETCVAGDGLLIVRASPDDVYSSGRQAAPATGLRPALQVYVLRGSTVARAEPPPAPLPLRTGDTTGCLPGGGVLSWSYDWKSFGVLTQHDGELAWTSIPAGPPGAAGPQSPVSYSDNVLTAWAPRVQEHVGFAFANGQWRELGVIPGTPPALAVLVGKTVVYQVGHGNDTTGLGLVGG
jgi:hypothetical protein